MSVYGDSSADLLHKEVYIALGSFDGLHLGHMTLINEAVKLAKENNSLSMVYTFSNHPLTIINPEKAPKLLMDNETKLSILKNSGIDITRLVDFDANFMKMQPEDFIKNLNDNYTIAGIIVGFNYRFGYKNTGNIETLHALSLKYGYKTYVMEPEMYDNEVISSSRIRALLSEGELSKVNHMLCEPYLIKGEIITGKKLGRKIGFPTANIKLDNKYLVPKVGVYYTNIVLENKVYKGITNIGFNPTVNGTTLSIETNILDFDNNIYGMKIKIYFISRIRPEIKFNSIEELRIQLELDKRFVLEQSLVII
jgi:riboflavin kinase/FMN adenylyltransferase